MQQKCAVKVLNLKKTTGAVPQKCSARSHAAHICSDHLYYALPAKTLPLHFLYSCTASKLIIILLRIENYFGQRHYDVYC